MINNNAMSEKWHKIDKFANYQNKIVRNSPDFDRHGFVPSILVPRASILLLASGIESSGWFKLKGLF